MLSSNVLLVGLAATGAAVLVWQRARLVAAWARVRRQDGCLRVRESDTMTRELR